MSIHPRRSAGLVLAALLIALPFMSGCDTTTPDPIFADGGVRSQTFTPRANQFTINTPGDIATFERSTNLLTPRVVDEGVVLLYARGDLILDGGEGEWTALPYTQGIEAIGDDGVPYVDFTITYAYSFGVERLYLDVISSALGLVDGYVPDNIPFRLVTIAPGTPRVEGVNYASYAEVAAAYGLAE
jgi:hypothetical protein